MLCSSCEKTGTGAGALVLSCVVTLAHESFINSMSINMRVYVYDVDNRATLCDVTTTEVVAHTYPRQSHEQHDAHNVEQARHVATVDGAKRVLVCILNLFAGLQIRDVINSERTSA